MKLDQIYTVNKEILNNFSDKQKKQKLAYIMKAAALLSADDAYDITEQVVKAYDSAPVAGPAPAPKRGPKPAPKRAAPKPKDKK